MMSEVKLTPKEESFAKSYIKHEGDLLKTYKGSDYSQNLSSAAMSVEANKLSKKPKIALRIRELESKVKKIAEEKFTVSVEQRLKWLVDVAEAGLGEYADSAGNMRKENLAATCKAVDTLNNMLGNGEDNNNNGEALTIQFNVAPAVGKVKVTNA